MNNLQVLNIVFKYLLYQFFLVLATMNKLFNQLITEIVTEYIKYSSEEIKTNNKQANNEIIIEHYDTHLDIENIILNPESPVKHRRNKPKDFSLDANSKALFIKSNPKSDSFEQKIFVETIDQFDTYAKNNSESRIMNMIREINPDFEHYE